MSLLEDVMAALDYDPPFFSRWNNGGRDAVPGMPLEICQYVDDDIIVVARYPASSEREGDEHVAALELELQARTAIDAVKANLKQRLVHDEEGVMAMLDGEFGPLETPPAS